MNHNIIPALEALATPIEKIITLPGNPHRGDVEAAVAVLKEFGQHSPLVGKGNLKDGGICLVGNTRLRAAKQLGWTHIAVAWHEEDEARALARALSDNELAKLGSDDMTLMGEALEKVPDYYEVFEALGIDDFDIAALTEQNERESETGYIAPQIVNPLVSDEVSPAPGMTLDEALAKPLPETTQPTPEPKEPKKAVVQYTMVFDDAIQQKRWYDFCRWLRSDPEVADYETTTAKVLAFLEARADF